MNNFEAKYIKISSNYLDEKLKLINSSKRKVKPIQKSESTISKIVNSLFKSNS